MDCLYLYLYLYLHLYLHMYLYLSSTSSTHFIDEAPHQCSAWEEALRENLLLPVHSCPLTGQHHVSSNICSCWCLYLYLSSRSQHRVSYNIFEQTRQKYIPCSNHKSGKERRKMLWKGNLFCLVMREVCY